MKQEFLDSLRLAISLDAIDFAKELFSSPSGFYIKVNDDKYAKVKGGHDLEFSDIQELVGKPPVEYYLNASEFRKTKSLASGMGCGVNNVGKLFRVDLNDFSGASNFKNAMADKGMIAYEVRSPAGIDISKQLAANIIKLRRNEQEVHAKPSVKM
jgi:hypothetical protein